jgi:hypothetical protein
MMASLRFLLVDRIMDCFVLHREEGVLLLLIKIQVWGGFVVFYRGANFHPKG